MDKYFPKFSIKDIKMRIFLLPIERFVCGTLQVYKQKQHNVIFIIQQIWTHGIIK